MKRRDLIGALGVGTVGLMALNRGEALAQHSDHHDQIHADCLKACGDCAKTCEMTFHHCMMLVTRGKPEHAKAAHYALDCAEFCSLSAKLIARMSDLMVDSCGACADACKKCGDECAKFDMPEMKACVAACRECEKTCRAMVKAMHVH